MSKTYNAERAEHAEKTFGSAVSAASALIVVVFDAAA
jgi:hypothetical protein